MPMKRLITLLSVALPVLLSGCSDEEDILPEQREKIRQQLEDQGLGDEARVFARREAALSWLVNNSRVSYK